MAKCEKLLFKARNSVSNLRFEEICSLAVCFGWEFQRQAGSHHIFLHPLLGNSAGALMNFQPRDGKAKPTQVRQLLEAIEELN